MARNETTSKAVGVVLRGLLFGGAMSVALTAPNLLQVLEKPLNKALDKLDEADREREKRRILSYMKTQGYMSGDYEHGLKITKKGKARLKELEVENLKIPAQKRWDKMWRIVIYDIPESKKSGRDALKSKLRLLGFLPLQRSAWIHPLPCREVIEKICTSYGISRYVSYIESPHLDNQKVLIKRFKKKIPRTSF